METLTAVAVAYVRFATENAALLELMFASKHLLDASAELQLVTGELDLVGLVMFATLQGITSLANIEMVEKPSARAPDRLCGRSPAQRACPEAGGSGLRPCSRTPTQRPLRRPPRPH